MRTRRWMGLLCLVAASLGAGAVAFSGDAGTLAAYSDHVTVPVEVGAGTWHDPAGDLEDEEVVDEEPEGCVPAGPPDGKHPLREPDEQAEPRRAGHHGPGRPRGERPGQGEAENDQPDDCESPAPGDCESCDTDEGDPKRPSPGDGPGEPRGPQEDSHPRGPEQPEPSGEQERPAEPAGPRGAERPAGLPRSESMDAPEDSSDQQSPTNNSGPTGPTSSTPSPGLGEGTDSAKSQ